MPTVSNTSPILNLAIIGRLSLLRQQFGEVIIPKAVLEECRIDENLLGTEEISAAIREGWLSVREISKKDEAVLLERELDKGESEAIALALELNADLVLIDERDARRICQSIDMKVTGVIGILARAYKDKQLPSLEDAFFQLKENAGFYIKDDLVKHILRATEG